MGDLDKLVVAKGLKTCPNSNKLPNMVTLALTYNDAVTVGSGQPSKREHCLFCCQ